MHVVTRKGHAPWQNIESAHIHFLVYSSHQQNSKSPPDSCITEIELISVPDMLAHYVVQNLSDKSMMDIHLPEEIRTTAKQLIFAHFFFGRYVPLGSPNLESGIADALGLWLERMPGMPWDSAGRWLRPPILAVESEGLLWLLGFTCVLIEFTAAAAESLAFLYSSSRQFAPPFLWYCQISKFQISNSKPKVRDSDQ